MDSKPSEPNLVVRVIAWEREQTNKGVILGPAVEAFVNEIAEAVRDSEKRRAKMTHAEIEAQLHRNPEVLRRASRS